MAKVDSRNSADLLRPENVLDSERKVPVRTPQNLRMRKY